MKKITSNHVLIVIGLVIVFLLLRGNTQTPSSDFGPIANQPARETDVQEFMEDSQGLDEKLDELNQLETTDQPTSVRKNNTGNQPAASPKTAAAAATKPYENDYFSVELPVGYTISSSGGGGKISYSVSGPDGKRYKVAVGSGTVSDQPELYKSTGKKLQIGGLLFKQYIYQGVSDFPYVYEYNGYDYGQGDFRIFTISASPDSDLSNSKQPFWSSFSFKVQ